MKCINDMECASCEKLETCELLSTETRGIILATEALRRVNEYEASRLKSDEFQG